MDSLVSVHSLSSRRVAAADSFTQWDPKYRIKVRVICARAYHALFMNNSELSASF